MIGTIWGRTQERACKELEIIKNRYLTYGEILTEIKKNSFKTQSGDYWVAVKTNEYARGYRCNISYIDKTIPEDIVNEIVIPATKAYPYRGFEYFDI